MDNNLIINLYEGQRHVETVEHAGAVPPVGSTFYTKVDGVGQAYEVESIAYVDEKHGGFIHGWVVFLQRVPMESTPLGTYDPGYYTPDGDKL